MRDDMVVININIHLAQAYAASMNLSSVMLITHTDDTADHAADYDTVESTTALG